MSDDLAALCTCGESVSAPRPRQGQSLYGTLAFRMNQHESRCGSNNGTGWAFDHPFGVADLDAHGNALPSYQGGRG